MSSLQVCDLVFNHLHKPFLDCEIYLSRLRNLPDRSDFRPRNCERLAKHFHACLPLCMCARALACKEQKCAKGQRDKHEETANALCEFDRLLKLVHELNQVAVLRFQRNLDIPAKPIMSKYLTDVNTFAPAQARTHTSNIEQCKKKKRTHAHTRTDSLSSNLGEEICSECHLVPASSSTASSTYSASTLR